MDINDELLKACINALAAINERVSIGKDAYIKEIDAVIELESVIDKATKEQHGTE